MTSEEKKVLTMTKKVLTMTKKVLVAMEIVLAKISLSTFCESQFKTNLN